MRISKLCREMNGNEIAVPVRIGSENVREGKLKRK